MLMQANYSFTEIPPSTMKKTITGYGWSTKEEVATKVANILNVPFESIVRANYYKSVDKAGLLKNYTLDGSDALGLAISLLPYLKDRGGIQDYVGRKSGNIKDSGTEA
jgi:hypothetical protein